MNNLLQPSRLRVRNIPTNILVGLVFNKSISYTCRTPSVRFLFCNSNSKGRAAAASKNFNLIDSPRSNCHSHTKKDDDVLIYHGSLTPQIRMVKIFSLCSSVAGLAAQPLLYKHAAELGGTGVIVAVATFVGFFTFVTPLLLHMLTRKYVTDMHHNSSTGLYSATLLTFFLQKKKVLFKPEEVEVPDVPGLFTSFKVKNKALFVDPSMFENPVHYGKLMGYDKPMDFMLSKDQTDESKKSN